MCDTMVAVPADPASGGAVWFAKNSDREPGEAQAVEHIPRKTWIEAKLQCTYIEIPQTTTTNEIVISRPFWMWGAEIGANEHGVAIGNEAVWTRLPVDKTGLTGMDMLRLALERASTARDALDLITSLLTRYGQGGACGYRNKNFRYHNSFLIADPAEAWVLETAGPFWAAERVRGVRTISNVLSIGKEVDLVADGAYQYARGKGWCRSADDFDFAKAFGNPTYRSLTGGIERSNCTRRCLTKLSSEIGPGNLLAALRDHNGHSPASGWKMTMPCAHASWMKTRQAGQTTGSMVSRLTPARQTHWLTGTSSPCLSVFKPIVLGGDIITTGRLPRQGYDAESLFWRHERLHRAVLKDYDALRLLIEESRQAMEARFVTLQGEAYSSKACNEMWEEHRQIIPEWVRRVEKAGRQRKSYSLFDRYWAAQEKLDHPVSP